MFPGHNVKNPPGVVSYNTIRQNVQMLVGQSNEIHLFNILNEPTVVNMSMVRHDLSKHGFPDNVIEAAIKTLCNKMMAPPTKGSSHE